MDLWMFIREHSLPGQTAAVEATVAELVAEAAELEAADADVDADADVADADWAACVRTTAAVWRCPSAVNSGLGGGDGCVGAAVGDTSEGEVLWLTQLSAD